MKTKKGFHLIGIAVRTTNENQQALQDIPALWNKFVSEQVASKIPNKLDNVVLCAYTEYEGDHMQPYTTVIGCRAAHLEDIPTGMRGFTLGDNAYEEFTAEGNLAEGVITQKWMEIWSADLDRNYIADFEVYGEQATNPSKAKVDIFVGVNK